MGADLMNVAKAYDAGGHLSNTGDRGAPTTAGSGPDSPLVDPTVPARQQASPHPPTQPIGLYFTKTFEIRLLGSEVQSHSIDMPVLSDYRIIVSTDRVRTFVTRGGVPAAASNLIGGVEVSTEWRAGTPPELDALVCTAQATDFGPDDLVVVGVDITVFLLTRNDQP
jgi:hypothetical protein